MLLAKEPSAGDYIIRSYEPGKLLINDDTYHHSVIVTMHQLIDDWAPQSFDELTEADIQQLIDLKPQIVLLGTGGSQRFLPDKWLAKFAEKKIGVEVLTTLSACHTFTILTSEGRNVLAALLIK
jgi:uncharacterized protein